MKIIFEKKKKDLTYYTHHTEERYEVDPENGKRRQNLKHLGPSDETEWLRLKWKTEKNISLPRVCGSYFGKSDQNTQKVKHDAFFFFLSDNAKQNANFQVKWRNVQVKQTEK